MSTSVAYLYWTGRKVPEIGERLMLPDGRTVEVTARVIARDGQPRKLTVTVLEAA